MSKGDAQRVALLRADAQTSPGPGLNQDPNQNIPETTQIKDEPEEQSVTQVCVSDSSAVCVKTEESSLLQQTDKQDEPQGEDVSAEPHLRSETERDTDHSSDTDNDEDWTAPVSCSDDGDHNQVQISAQNSDLSSKYKSAAETRATVSNRDKTGTAKGAEGKMQQCPVCKKRIKGSKHNLQVHMRIHTGERPYSCSTCNKSFAHLSHLCSHRRKHTGERPYSCSSCDKTFHSLSNLIRHRITHTGERPYSCTTCNKTFTQITDLNRHKRMHTGEKPYICSTCNKTFNRICNLVAHRRTHTGERPYCCSTCKKTFTRLGHLNRHKTLHTEERLSEKTSSLTGPVLNHDLNQEIPETSQIKDEPEEQSGKHLCVPESSAVCVKTEESSLLQQTEHKQEEPQEEDVSAEPHLHSETERDTERSSDTDQDEDWTAPFSCSDDEDQHNQVQISAQNSDLSSKHKSAAETRATVKNGEKSGTAEGAEGKMHQCPVCKKKIKGSKYDLQNHVRIHTGERPHSCSFCNKTFTLFSNLNVHRRIHTGEKPYSCSTCNKTFNTKSSLNRHRRTHTGERPYSCPFCNKKFTQFNNLNVHIRMHTGERPYICSTCNKTFNTKSGLINHRRTHTDEN